MSNGAETSHRGGANLSFFCPGLRWITHPITAERVVALRKLAERASRGTSQHRRPAGSSNAHRVAFSSRSATRTPARNLSTSSRRNRLRHLHGPLRRCQAGRSEVLESLGSGAGYIAGFAGYARPGIVSKCSISLRGEVAERLKAAVLKVAWWLGRILPRFQLLVYLICPTAIQQP